MAFDPRFASNGRFYIDYTNTRRRHARRALPGRRGSNPTAPTRRRGACCCAIDQPYATTTAASCSSDLTAGSTWAWATAAAPATRRTAPRTTPAGWARSCASPSALAAQGRHVRARAAQPVALLVRPRQRATSGSATSARTPGKRSTVLRAGRPAGANLGWSGYEGTHVYDQRDGRQARQEQARLAREPVQPQRRRTP